MRSLATRRQHLATSAVLADCIDLLKSAGFDLVVVETAGIGQSDSEIVDLVDVPMYVMTSEYGAASQLEKIDMLDFADLVVLNKFEKRGAEDALRDVRKQWRRNRVAFKAPDDAGAGVPDHRQPLQRSGRQSAVRRALREAATQKARRRGPLDRRRSGPDRTGRAPRADARRSASRYLAEIAAQRPARARPPSAHSAAAASRAQSLLEALRDARRRAAARAARALSARRPWPTARPMPPCCGCARRYNEALDAIGTEGVELLRAVAGAGAGRHRRAVRLQVRGKEIRGDNYARR